MEDNSENILRQDAIALFAHLEQILQCFLEFGLVLEVGCEVDGTGIP